MVGDMLRVTLNFDLSAWGCLLVFCSNRGPKIHRCSAREMGQTDGQTDGRTEKRANRSIV